MPKGYKKLTTTQILEISRILAENIQPDGDRYVKYPEGMSDKTVAEQVGATAAGVQRIRTELHGTIRTGKPKEETPAEVGGLFASEEVKELKAEVAMLSEDVDKLTKAVNKLSEWSIGAQAEIEKLRDQNARQAQKIADIDGRQGLQDKRWAEVLERVNMHADALKTIHSGAVLKSKGK